MMVKTLSNGDLRSIKHGGHYLRFADGDVEEEVKACSVSFDRCEWQNVRMKHIRFVGSAIKRCSFKSVYMPNAVFDRCDLTGTSFSDCDLRKAKFTGSKLWYLTFANCEVNYDDLIANAPQEENLRRRLFHSLRLNALGRRENRQANKLLLVEMAAMRKEAENIVMQVDDYFRSNFSRKDRLVESGRWLLYTLEKYVWGYGVRLGALLRSAVLVVVGFAILMWLTDPLYLGADGGFVKTGLFWRSLYLSAAGFTALGGPEPANSLARVYSVVQASLGGIFLGLFAAAAFKRIER